MRGFSFAVRRDAGLKPAERRLEVYDPAAVQNRLNRSMRRRFTDDLGNLIRRACLSGHIEAAQNLLDVLRDQFEREKQQFPQGRMPAELLLQELAREIAAASGKRAA